MGQDKIVTIHQPDFLPYLGFFDRLIKSNLLVVLDNVQFVKGSKNAWQYRDKIKTPRGEEWITVSTLDAPLGTKINNIFLNPDERWKSKMLGQIRQNYLRAPFFNEVFPLVENIILFKTDLFSKYSWNSIETIMKALEIEREIVFSSELEIEGQSNSLVAKIVEKLNGKYYLSGVGARAYFEPGEFDKRKIEVVWQEFVHPQYSQLHSNVFIPNLSVIDMLFNCGIEGSNLLIRKFK